MPLVLMTLATGDQQIEKSIEQLIAQWKIANKLTFVFWTQENPQKVCVRLLDPPVVEKFRAVLRWYQAASPDLIEFEVLTEKHMPDIEAVSVLM